jgi:hypothetical protein
VQGIDEAETAQAVFLFTAFGVGERYTQEIVADHISYRACVQVLSTFSYRMRYCVNMQSFAFNQDIFSRPSVQALVFANMVPLIGVLFFGWSLFSVVFLYWMENVIIGLFNVLRMAKARGPVDPRHEMKLNGLPYTSQSRVFLIIFFIFHYGIFTVVHSTFLVLLFGPFDMTPMMVFAGVSALILSHAISYQTNFIGRGEYKRVNEGVLFMQPYNRVIVLHVSIIAGGFVTQFLGSPVLALVLFIIFKTAVDVGMHTKERNVFARGDRS